jgi:superfamily I DNA/RNA helicase
MIDEFQDTSKLQWQNFKPLILDAEAAGHNNLIVGDVKQSIYRFRNSDWHLLNQVDNDNDFIEKQPALFTLSSLTSRTTPQSSLFFHLEQTRRSLTQIMLSKTHSLIFYAHTKHIHLPIVRAIPSK